MNLNEVIKLLPKYGSIIFVLALVLAPIIWGIIWRLLKNQIEEQKSKNRKLEEELKNTSFTDSSMKDYHFIWENIYENISKIPNSEIFLSTLKGIERPFINLSGIWDMNGVDIEVSEMNIEYSLKLNYSGECEIKQFSNRITITGHVTGRDTDDQSKLFHWNIIGTGIIKDYVGIYYHLYPKTMAPTCGVLFFHVNRSGTELRGFFLAKRALKEDIVGQEQGFGFGYVTFTKKVK